MLGNPMSVIRGHTIRIEGFLDASAAEAWSCLTRPERLADWLGDAEVELRPGGTFRLRLDNGERFAGSIVALEPQRRLIIRSRDGGFRFDLTPVPDGTRLGFQISLPAEADVADQAALWHARLDRASAAVHGQTMVDVDTRLSQLRASYQALGEAAVEPRSGPVAAHCQAREDDDSVASQSSTLPT